LRQNFALLEWQSYSTDTEVRRPESNKYISIRKIIKSTSIPMPVIQKVHSDSVS